MRKIATICFCALSLLSCSCTKILMIREGIKQPRIESYERLSTYLLSQKIDTTGMLCFEDISRLTRFYKQGLGLPNARFFNKHGQFVDYRESPQDCNGMVSEFMKRVTAINGLPADETQSLSIETNGLVFISNHIPVELKEGDYDAYCLIYWAKYLGKLNKRKVFEWQSLAQEASEKGLRVKVLLVNADYQSFWGLEAGDLPEFAF